MKTAKQDIHQMRRIDGILCVLSHFREMFEYTPYLVW